MWLKILSDCSLILQSDLATAEKHGAAQLLRCTAPFELLEGRKPLIYPASSFKELRPPSLSPR